MRLINADALYETLCHIWDRTDSEDFEKAVFHEIENAPVVEERKTGKWIWDDEGCHCSECFFHAYENTLECMDGTYKYCPNCGARMMPPRKDEERRM